MLIAIALPTPATAQNVDRQLNNTPSGSAGGSPSDRLSNPLIHLNAANAPVDNLTASSSTAPNLSGSSWQLVKFQGGDDRRLTPDNKGKYTITFNTNNSVNVRFDCNRGRGTWRSTGPNQLQFGSLALTRAKCPPGSLHDRLVKDWGYVRSYVIKNGHLFLSLMADGGIYEFEPISTVTPPKPR